MLLTDVMFLLYRVLCLQVFALNYSAYSMEDFLNWDRDAMVSNNTPTQECSAWAYDRSIFDNTIVSQV